VLATQARVASLSTVESETPFFLAFFIAAFLRPSSTLKLIVVFIHTVYTPCFSGQVSSAVTLYVVNQVMCDASNVALLSHSLQKAVGEAPVHAALGESKDVAHVTGRRMRVRSKSNRSTVAAA